MLSMSKEVHNRSGVISTYFFPFVDLFIYLLLLLLLWFIFFVIILIKSSRLYKRLKSEIAC